MSKLKYSIVVGGILVCLGLAGYFTRVEHTQLTAVSAELIRVKANDEQRIAALKRQLAVLGADRQARIAHASVQHDRLPAKSPHRSFLSMRQDPVFRAIWKKEERRSIERQFGDTINGFNLPSEKASRLRELLIERLDAQADAVALAREARLPADQTTAAGHLARDEVDQDIEALIGKDDLAALNRPQASLFKPMVENSVGIDLAMAGAPLSTSQVDAVAQCFVKLYTAPPGAGLGAATVNPATGLAPFYQSILDEAAPKLTPDQIPVVKDYLFEKMQEQKYFSSARAANAPINVSN